MSTQSIYDDLAKTAKIIGMPFYWLDLNQIIRGVNDLGISSIGAVSSANVIGKSIYDLYPHNLAHPIVLHHQTVINSGETLVVEEAIKNIATGAFQYYTATIWVCRDDELNPQDKNRVVFLSDYELLRQPKNGLQIIEESEIKNATLVTSYYTNSSIRDKAIQLGVKILPKQMASIVPIEVDLNRVAIHHIAI